MYLQCRERVLSASCTHIHTFTLSLSHAYKQTFGSSAQYPSPHLASPSDTHVSRPYMYFITMCCLGLSDSGFNTQLYSVLGYFCSTKSQAAFACEHLFDDVTGVCWCGVVCMCTPMACICGSVSQMHVPTCVANAVTLPYKQAHMHSHA